MISYRYIENLRKECNQKKKKWEKLKILFEERNRIQKIVLTENLTEPFLIYSQDRSRYEYIKSERKIFGKELDSYKSLLGAIDKLIEEIKLTVPDDKDESFDDLIEDVSTDPSFTNRKGNLTNKILSIVDGFLDSGFVFTRKQNEIHVLSLKIKKFLDEKSINYNDKTINETLKRILNHKRLFEEILKEFVTEKNYSFQSFEKQLKLNKIPFSKSYVRNRFEKICLGHLNE